jgi:hypothetical protein
MRELAWYALWPMWDQLVATAREIDRVKDGYATQRIWRSQQNLMGLCGEQVFALDTGRLLNRDVYLGGDGGADFDGGINVKATPWLPDRLVTGRMHLIENAPPKHWARFYVLTVIDEARQLGAIFGWARGRELRAAPIHDFGFGPRHAIPADDLHHWRPPRSWRGPGATFTSEAIVGEPQPTNGPQRGS